MNKISDLNMQLRHDVRIIMKEIAFLSAAEQHRNDTPWLYNNVKKINQMGISLLSSLKFIDYIESEENNTKLASGVYDIGRLISKILHASEYISKNSDKSIGVNKDIRYYGKFEGPDIFDFIPFAILQNCIKYSVRGRKVDVGVYEGEGGEAAVHFLSLGPRIEDDEFEKIFEKGFRGVNARKSGIVGNGIGLYHARRAIRALFLGDITVTRRDSSSIDINGVPYCFHLFRLTVPCI